MFDHVVRQKVGDAERVTGEINGIVTLNPDSSSNFSVSNRAASVFIICKTGTPAKNDKIPRDKLIRSRPEVTIMGLNEATLVSLFSQAGVDYLYANHDVKMVEEGVGPVSEFNEKRKPKKNKEMVEIQQDLAEHVRLGFAHSRTFEYGESL
jgi:hypothetical protein